MENGKFISNMIGFTKVPSPCYVLIETLLENNLKLLKHVIDSADINLLCSLKGYSMWETFPLIGKYLNGGAASSLNEAKLIFDEMGVRAHTYCPVYIEETFDEILEYSSHITFNSLSQYQKFYHVVKKYGKKISCGLRINSEYSEIKVDIYNPATPLSRLGITVEHFGEKLPEGIEGLHFHLLCEQDSYVLERVLAKVEEKFQHLLKQCKWINIGGGHLITHKNYDVEHLMSLLKSFKSRYPNVNIILEPGGAIGWETGFLVSKVLDIIEKKDISIAMLDVSFSAHMPDTLEMPYKPDILGATDPQKGKPVYRFGGLTCLAGDFIGDYSFEKPLKVDDIIVFDDQIHYTFVKTNFFNGVQHPSIGKIDKDNNFVMIRKFSHEDFKNKLS